MPLFAQIGRVGSCRSGGSRRWRGFDDRMHSGRINFERLQCFVIQIAGNLQAIANLIPPDRRRRVGIFRSGHFAVIKPLILQRLLHVLDQVIGSGRNRDRAERNKDCERNLHMSSICFDAGTFALFSARLFYRESKLSLF